MLESIRYFRQRGAKIRVVAFDDEKVQSDQQGREKAMAENILEALRPGEVAIVLVGNYHARTVQGAPWNPSIRWMSFFLREKEPRLVTLDNRYLDGSAWTCSSAEATSCGVKSFRGLGTREDWAIERFSVSSAEGYSGVFQVGRAIASPPAVKAESLFTTK